MKRSSLTCGFLVFSIVFAFSTRAQQIETAPQESTNSAKSASMWRYELGLRSLHMELSKDKQGEPFNGSFIGSINELDVNQQYAPVHPYLQVLREVNHLQLGLGFTYDSWSVATVDSGGGDGDVEMDAWTFYVVGRLTTESKISPFAEIGWAMYDNSFDPIPSWYAGGRRNFFFDDSTGLHLAAGFDYAFSGKAAINVYVRYVDVELDGEYVFRGDDRPPEPFTFPMEHIAYGLGFSYSF